MLVLLLHLGRGGGLAGVLGLLVLLDEPQGAQAALQVPLEVGRDQAAALTAVPRLAGVGDLPVAAEQRAEVFQRLPRGYDASRYAALPADHTARADGEETVGTGHAAPGAVVKA